MLQKIKQIASYHYPDTDIIEVLTSEEFFLFHNKLDHPYKFKFNEYNVKLSKTFKVAMRGNYTCAGCNSIAQYVVFHTDRISPSNDENSAYASAWIIDDKGVPQPLTKDHILPKCAGGPDSYDNLQSMCYECNQQKACDVDPEMTPSNKPHIISVDADVYSSHSKKVKDFSILRKKIKRLGKNMPWYYRLLGVDKFVERELKKPLEDKGYYQEKNS